MAVCISDINKFVLKYRTKEYVLKCNINKYCVCFHALVRFCGARTIVGFMSYTVLIHKKCLIRNDLYTC